MCGRILSLQVVLVSIVFASSSFINVDAAPKKSSARTQASTTTTAPAPTPRPGDNGTKVGEDCKKKSSGAGAYGKDPILECISCGNTACSQPPYNYRVGSWEWNECCDAADKICHPPTPTPTPTPVPSAKPTPTQKPY